MDEWLFLTKLPWGMRPSGRGGSHSNCLIGDLTITHMHHTAGADTGFLKTGVYSSHPRYEKRASGPRGGGGGGGGTGTGENSMLQALYPPPYGKW